MPGSPSSELKPSIAEVRTHRCDLSLADLVEALEAMRQAGWILSSTTRPGGIAYGHE